MRLPFFPDLSRVCARLAAHLAPPRVIMGRSGTEPYLSRYYLIGDAPKALDAFGNQVADEREATKGLGALLPRVYLHRFHRSDEDPELHSHPWKWAYALVLGGGYVEERRERAPKGTLAARWSVRKRSRLPGAVVPIRADDFHRVDLIGSESWSLFVAGPKVSGWAFWDRLTWETVPWREFLQQRQMGRQAERAPKVRRTGPGEYELHSVPLADCSFRVDEDGAVRDFRRDDAPPRDILDVLAARAESDMTRLREGVDPQVIEDEVVAELGRVFGPSRLQANVQRALDALRPAERVLLEQRFNNPEAERLRREASEKAIARERARREGGKS